MISKSTPSHPRASQAVFTEAYIAWSVPWPYSLSGMLIWESKELTQPSTAIRRPCDSWRVESIAENQDVKECGSSCSSGSVFGTGEVLLCCSNGCRRASPKLSPASLQISPHIFLTSSTPQTSRQHWTGTSDAGASYLMMASEGLSARLKYLNKSANLLAIAAPSTSCHLMSRRNSLIAENDLPLSEAQKRSACRACGTIMVLGWEGTMGEKTRSRRTKKTPQSGQDIKKAVLSYKCDTCGRQTRFESGPKPPAYRRKSASSKLNSTSVTTATTSVEVKTNAKKRSKARKRGGLEALLAAKKTEPETSGFGLDLMDFMKKGWIYFPWELRQMCLSDMIRYGGLSCPVASRYGSTPNSQEILLGSERLLWSIIVYSIGTESHTRKEGLGSVTSGERRKQTHLQYHRGLVIWGVEVDTDKVYLHVLEAVQNHTMLIWIL